MDFEPVALNISDKTARGLEQMLIMQCRTLNRNNRTNNQINGIYKYNNDYQIFWDAAASWASENEIPCR